MSWFISACFFLSGGESESVFTCSVIISHRDGRYDCSLHKLPPPKKCFVCWWKQTFGVEAVYRNKRHGELEQNWMLNRPALCCTWSCGSCERPCRVSSLDTAVPDTPNTAVSPGVSSRFSWKREGLLLFQLRLTTSPRARSPLVFTSWFNYLCGTTLLRYDVHTLDWRDVRNCTFTACGVCYSRRSQALQPVFPFTEVPLNSFPLSI